MEMVIVLGGGDAGVLIITPKGIRRIGPFGPEVLHELKAVNNLVRVGKEFGDVATRLSGHALAQIGKATGTSGASVVFADGDDVVYCGNGKLPIPLPHGELVRGEFLAA
ncbi:MAG TPA: hypothetical protein VGP73_14135 [Thermoanaerobaculia bacterium]